MKAALKAVAWVALGALVTVVLVVDPLQLHPFNEWLEHRFGPSTSAHPHGVVEAVELFTCPMHPQILQEQPGSCPICGMDLVPVKPESEPEIVSQTDDAHHMWTCPMHPQILEQQPGSCPICGMDLVAVKDQQTDIDAAAPGSSDRHQGPVVHIDPAVTQNMNVTTETIGRRDIVREIRTVGSLDYDLEGMVTVTTRYPGFVEKVYVDAIGATVRRGDPLFDIYAPELVQTQRELLSAIRYADSLSGAAEDVRRRARDLVHATRARLDYWDLTEDQIGSIERDGEVHRTVTVFAPSSGIVMKRAHGLAGMAVQPGMDVIHIADLSKLLLTAQVFEDQLQWVAVGMTVKIDVTYFAGETLVGRVRFIEPEFEDRTRTIRLLVEVPNPDGKLRVGMYANVSFSPALVKDAVAVPTQSVLRTGERTVVVMALGEGRFAPREVSLGVEGDDGYVQVLEGVAEGGQIVTSSQFLIDSESNLRAAISQMTAAASHAGH